MGYTYRGTTNIDMFNIPAIKLKLVVLLYYINLCYSVSHSLNKHVYDDK